MAKDGVEKTRDKVHNMLDQVYTAMAYLKEKQSDEIKRSEAALKQYTEMLEPKAKELESINSDLHPDSYIKKREEVRDLQLNVSMLQENIAQMQNNIADIE